MVLNTYFIRSALRGRKETFYGVNGEYTFENNKINGLEMNSWRDIYDYMITQGEEPKIMFYGNILQPQEIESGYVSYGTLAKCGNLVFLHSDEVLEEFYVKGFGYNEETEEYTDIFQAFAIDNQLAEIIERYCPTEYVMYSDVLGCSVWGITHWGTSWDYVNAISIDDLCK